MSRPPLDFTVRVDRSLPPTYPDYNYIFPVIKKVLHPELELTGPAEYDLEKDVFGWLAKGQVSPRVPSPITGEEVYRQLLEQDAMGSCLGLLDLTAIQAGDKRVFEKLFLYKLAYGWRSIGSDESGDLFVPYLREVPELRFDNRLPTLGQERMIIDWRLISGPLLSVFTPSMPAFRWRPGLL